MISERIKAELFKDMIEAGVLLEVELDPEVVRVNKELIDAMESVKETVMVNAPAKATQEDMLVGFCTLGMIKWKGTVDTDMISKACLTLKMIYEAGTDKQLQEWAMKMRLRGNK